MADLDDPAVRGLVAGCSVSDAVDRAASLL